MGLPGHSEAPFFGAFFEPGSSGPKPERMVLAMKAFLGLNEPSYPTAPIGLRNSRPFIKVSYR